MTKQVSEIKKLAYYFCAWAFTFANFLAFLVSRDHDRIHNPGQAWMDASATDFRTYPASEFERTLSCYGIGQCQRIAGALIFQPLIFLADSISKFYYWNVDDQSRIFIIQMVGLGWRALALGILGFCVFRVSKNLAFVIFALNSLLLSLSGWLLRLLGHLIHNLPSISDEFKMRSTLAFQDFPYENFKWYDFGLFAVLAVIAILIIKISERKTSNVHLFLLGTLVTSFFEYLGFVFALSFIFFNIEEQKLRTTAKEKFGVIFSVLLGSFLWLSFITIFYKVMESLYPKFYSTDPTERETLFSRIKIIFWAIQHPIENLTSNPSILFQICLVILQCSILAMITGFIARICLKPIQVEPKFINAFKSVAIAMFVVIFVTVFMAYGVKIQAGEHARQTMGLQISLFLYIFIRTSSNKKSLAESI